jgi:hypothetical protein
MENVSSFVKVIFQPYPFIKSLEHVLRFESEQTVSIEHVSRCDEYLCVHIYIIAGVYKYAVGSIDSNGNTQTSCNELPATFTKETSVPTYTFKASD